ncbi:hypothetical protein BOTBODRAFT_40142 [Botryobasidium botryosum FD-172 SS1]|uniref:Uncharacterized protein n=1 Tax=Botryobasidium botryosum (strain FD-172 SS1) TaxID=930990 RepID=A0A067MZZ6_BOTB1|nr:hypothetical protein BOTBODRAFT_40142 [Botryobasidium botryosum FD-172 SS1]
MIDGLFPTMIIRLPPPLLELQIKPYHLDTLQLWMLSPEEQDLYDPPEAIQETESLRVAYLHAAIANIIKHHSVPDCNDQLEGTLDSLYAHGLDQVDPKPAKTLETAKRRLNIDADRYIEKRPCCTVCFKYHSQEQINLLPPGGKCTEPGCKGLIFEVKRDRDGNEHRHPIKIFPYSSIIKNLCRMLMRPDFVQNLRDPSLDSEAFAGLESRDDHYLMKDVHDGVKWLQDEIGLRRVVGPDGKVSDVEVSPGSRSLVIGVLYGFRFTLNLDWFGMTDGRPHSTGGCYVSINNLHRSVRLLQHNVLFPFAIPGPHEPSREELNHMFVPLVDEFQQLYSSVVMNVCFQTLPQQIHAIAHNQTSDTPASRKLNGQAAHSHKRHPCPVCSITLEDINLPAGYDIDNFKLKADADDLQYAFEARNATTAAHRKRILDDHGVRWSVLNLLAFWLPIACAPLDFMHNMYLGIMAHFFINVVIEGYLLNKEARTQYQNFMDAVIWPSGIGRLPKNLAENPKLKKADEWRRAAGLWPIAFFVVWGNEDDAIPSQAPKVPANAKKKPTWIRNLSRIYGALLMLCVAARILSSKAISVDTARRGIDSLRRYCLALLALKIHLVPNHHVAMHYLPWFKAFGPVYGWWLFAFERFNGILERVKTNNHANGEMELTLVRYWVQYHRLYELASCPYY